jgi:hypothetical protein
MLGFRLHAADADFPFGFPDFVDRSEEFYKSWSNLRTRLIERLRELKKQMLQTAATPATLFAAPAQPAGQIFLHASRTHEAERDALGQELTREGFAPVTLPLGASAAQDFGQEERRAQVKWMKRCDAVALATFDGGAAEEEEFDHIFDSRREIVGPSGRPPPLIVLDRSGGRLPIPAGVPGLARIDATRDDWRGALRACLGGSP